MNKNKVVINRLGESTFRLSDEAIELYIKKTRGEDTNVKIVDHTIYINGKEIDEDAFIFCESIPRHDKKLIEAIEELKEYADSDYTWLEIVRIKGNKYMILETDGGEMLIQPEDIEWEIIE